MTNADTKKTTCNDQERFESLSGGLTAQNKADLYRDLDKALELQNDLDGEPTNEDTYKERVALLNEENNRKHLNELYSILICQAAYETPPEVDRNTVVMIWHSISSIRADLFETAHTALSQIDLKDPEGAQAVIDCVASYIQDNIIHLDDHLEDLKCYFNKLYPLNEVWPSKAEELNVRVDL